MDHVDAGHQLEQFAGYVAGGTDAGRRHVDLAGIGLRIGDEVGNGLGRNRWVHHHDAGLAANARDRRDVMDEIETEPVVERRVDHVRRAGQEKCVTVWWRAHDRFGADIAASTRAVLDNELLAEPLREPLRDQAREDVGRRSSLTDMN
jgi:hypothetical protein